MIGTIDIRPTGETEYYVGLNLHTKAYELADISYIVSELTKCVKHIEYTVEQMKESRNTVKEGDTNDK